MLVLLLLYSLTGGMKSPMAHYHIRWRDSDLDWEAFSTQEAAELRAAALVRPNETYAIEQFDGNCPQCLSLETRILKRA